MGYMTSALIFAFVGFAYGCQQNNYSWTGGVVPFIACLLVGLGFVAGSAIIKRIRGDRTVPGDTE